MLITSLYIVQYASRHYMYHKTLALNPFTCWYSAILIGPPPGDRKWPKFDMHHTLMNSSYNFDLNVMKYCVNTLQTCVHGPICMKLYMYDKRPALNPFTCWKSAILIAPTPGDRKWANSNMCRTLVNSGVAVTGSPFWASRCERQNVYNLSVHCSICTKLESFHKGASLNTSVSQFFNDGDSTTY